MSEQSRGDELVAIGDGADESRPGLAPQAVEPAPPVGESSADLAPAMTRFAIVLLALVAVAATTIRGQDLAIVLLWRQDVAVSAMIVLLLLMLAARPAWFARVPAARLYPPRPVLMAMFVLLATAGGAWLVFGNFDLSRDEFLANFDATAFAHRHAFAPISAEWKPYADAMMPLFMRQLTDHVGWISGYLPGNAMLRSLADLTVGRSWTSPILAAVSVLTLAAIARRLWPEARDHAAVPVLLLVVSPQFLTMAMTPWAMTAHLTFNLLWLRCYLQDSRRGDAGALACGFVATGLHQIVFHPLFAAPFILELLLQRRFARAAIFIAGYAAIGLFWMFYPALFLPLAHAQTTGGLTGMANAIGELLHTFSGANVFMMLLNLIRFAAWQNPLLIVLAALAWPIIRSGDPIARPLFVGVIAILFICYLLMPWQGNGWGYRYLHGYIGSLCLLAGYGWTRVRDQMAARRVLIITSVATILLILPFQLATTATMVRPYRVASAMIAKSGADVVLVDTSYYRFGSDVIRNDADPRRLPKAMDLQLLSEDDLKTLCNRYDVRLFDQRHALAAGIAAATTKDLSGHRAILPAIGCDHPLPLPLPSR